MRLAGKAAALRKEGMIYDEIASRLGISRSYVAELVGDPAGNKGRARKDSYRGTCERCGAPTDGSNGPRNAPQFCHRCVGREKRIWTEDAIIGAIQEWARVQGRPPLSQEWLVAVDGRVEPGQHRRWPATATVLERFGSWANAIEQAGFPRPKIGHKVNQRGKGANSMARQYIVLHQNGHGAQEVARVEAYSPELAIEKVAEGEGDYVAVLSSYWVEATVRPVTKLAAARK